MSTEIFMISFWYVIVNACILLPSLCNNYHQDGESCNDQCWETAERQPENVENEAALNAAFVEGEDELRRNRIMTRAEIQDELEADNDMSEWSDNDDDWNKKDWM